MSIDNDDLFIRDRTTGRTLIEEHFVQIYQAHEELFLAGNLTLPNYINALRSAHGIVPVHEFYKRLKERGDITGDHFRFLLTERETLLEQKLKQPTKTTAYKS